MKTDVHMICQLKTQNKGILSCYGCCGRKFKSEKELEFDIDNSTNKFWKFMIVPSTLRLLEFRDRFSNDSFELKKSGICANLVKFKNGVYACPLHKSINEIIPKTEFCAIHRKDLRWGHCDVNFECETVLLWKTLSERQRKEYLEWLGPKEMSVYEYSCANVKGELIDEFMEENYPNW